MVLLIIRFAHIDKACRPDSDLFSVRIAGSAEDHVDQPHIECPVQVEDLSKLCKRAHKHGLYKILQFRYGRLIRQRRIERKNKKAAVNGTGMLVLFASEIGKIRKISIIILTVRCQISSACSVSYLSASHFLTGFL